MSRLCSALWVCLLMGGGALGCSANLQVTKLRSVTKPPAHVAVSLTVHDGAGAPVSGLTAENFQLMEDDEPVDPQRSRLRVLHRGPSAQRYALLLVDMGDADVREDGGAQLAYLVSDFVAELESHQKVAVYVFDGSKGIRRIRPFVNSDEGRKGLFTLLSYRPNGAEVDLHRSIREAMKVLKGQLRRAKVPPEFGTLVLLSHSADRVEGAERKALMERVEESGLSTYAVAVGEDVDDGLLSRLGSKGYVRVPKLAQIKPALTDISTRVSRWSDSHYVVRYCSGGRGGPERSILRVTYGDEAHEIEYTVDATGFERGCGSKRQPDAKGEKVARKRRHAAVGSAAKRAARPAAKMGGAQQASAKRLSAAEP